MQIKPKKWGWFTNWLTRLVIIYLLFVFLEFLSLSCYNFYILKSNTGPGLRNPDERTMEYLEEVAIDCARGIADKRIPLTKEKGLMQSMCPISVLLAISVLIVLLYTQI